MRRFLLMIILSGVTVVGFAQNEGKYTTSTLMFLNEELGATELPKIGEKRPMGTGKEFGLDLNDPTLKNKFQKRRIAQAEMVNGVKMISGFIGVSDNNFAVLEALGVAIEYKFDKLCTALIPVSKIEEIAALDNVTRIEVSEILEPYNDVQRTVTKAYDAISNSSAAQSLGLTKAYTGKGVILGIIDSGIDFRHIAFKDKNGNTRIKRAYTLSGTSSLNTYSTTTQINNLTCDTNSGDHGTHTSTTAGGSSVIVNGTNVTVTDDHANATYGGMAPEADLVICGLSSLYTAAIATAIGTICDYADQVGEPCVISLSMGSQTGPHDGTGSVANVVNQKAGNNHIIVYAASNDAMKADYFVQAGTTSGGGMYASGTAANSKPLLANLQKAWTNADGNIQILPADIFACARTANTAISMRFRVVDTTTGNVVYSSSAYSSSTTISMTGSSGLAQYFKSSSGNYNSYGDDATIRIVRGQDTYSRKYYFMIYTPMLVSSEYGDDDGDGVYNSRYALCVSFYPSSGSTIVDMWESGYYDWFGNDLKLSSTYANSYTIAKGSDDCSVSDNACISNVISVGAYVSKNVITDYQGTSHDFSGDYPNIGDHAYFSSWQTAGYGPLGTALPTINAPGARVVAGVNHYHTASVDDYSYYGDSYKTDLVVNSTNYPYAAMEGTSMATPCVSGIVAQWLQACVEAGKTPTPDYIKEVMQNTWDTDQWTNGTGSGAHGANTFGTHGKINAIKGLQYILGVTGGPSIKATTPDLAESVNFTGIVDGGPYTKTVTVTGVNLEGNVTVSISGDNVFSVSPTNISVADATAGATVTITWNPTAEGETSAVITFSSVNAESVTLNVYGKANLPEIITDPEALTFECMATETDEKTFDVLAENLLEDVTVTLTDANNVFSIDKASISKADAEEGATVTVTFAPQAMGEYTGTVTLTSRNAEPVTVQLNGTATKKFPNYFDVTISKYGVSTLYLDYPVIIPSDPDLLGVFYAYQVTENEVKLARVRNFIPAYTGVVVQGNSGTYRFNRTTEAVNPLSRTNYLTGTVVEGGISKEQALTEAGASADAIVMTLGQGSNGYVGFYKYTGSKKLAANKAFLIYDPAGSSYSVNTLSISGMGGEFTGIQELDATQGSGAWYTPQGVRLNGTPKQRGIYIRDGKTVVVK